MAPTSKRKRILSGTQEVPKFNSINNNSKINLNDYEEVEDEYGFKYMKKKQKLILSQEVINANVKSISSLNVMDSVISTPVTKGSTINTTINHLSFSPSTPTPSKQILENNRKKRRSSFAVASTIQNNIRNSFGGTSASSLKVQLPPDNVKIEEYHRHIQTDLPGPVKMRQLMIWACQKAASNNNVRNVMSKKIVHSLVNNEICTSWYQRSNKNDSSVTNYLPNPQNQELSECIELYKNYQVKLENECKVWEELKSNPSKESLIKFTQNSSCLKIDNTLNFLFSEEFQNLNKWLINLPLSIDRLDWNTKLALSFQDNAKQFCEGVFHQIFAKFFSSDSTSVSGHGKLQRIEPMMILRALSTGI